MMIARLFSYVSCFSVIVSLLTFGREQLFERMDRKEKEIEWKLSNDKRTGFFNALYSCARYVNSKGEDKIDCIPYPNIEIVKVDK